MQEDLMLNSNASDASHSLRVQVDVVGSRTVSYAAVQNNVPIVQSIRLENNTDEAISDVEVLISSNPSFVQGQKLHFSCLQAREVRLIEAQSLSLAPNHEYLAHLNEAECGAITVQVVIAGHLDSRQTVNVDVLAHNEWGGTRGLPELLAAFVQPNSIVIDRVLGAAGEKLSQKNLSLDGYQSKNRERIWTQINAVFLVLRQHQLQYSSPPASFERSGQKIRTSERIWDAKVSTCLDSAVLLAACFEQAGLNAVVALKDGHAWVGVWLVDTCFATPIIDCAQDVRKRVATGELLMIEATAITQNGVASLNDSVIAANAYLDELTTMFSYLVDVKRARLTHIRALKDESAPTPVDVPVNPIALNNTDFESAPILPALEAELLPPTEMPVIETPQGRLIRWKSKLLDLTLRNKLLNFKAGKTFLKIISLDPHLIEDALATDGHEFKLLSCPPLMEGNDPRSAQAYISEVGMTPAQNYAKQALKNAELVFDVPGTEFDARLVDILRAAKNAIEETGANTLYVSIGMLHWKESPDSETVLKAPLLLIPVTLKRGAVGAGIRLTRHDDEAIFNPTLLQRLVNDFEMVLPFSDGQLPADENGVDVDAVLQTVRRAVAELKGFEVVSDCYLGNFSFSKYVMWKDLNSRVEELSKSEIVNHLINHQKESFSDGIKSVRATELDEYHAPNSLFTPLISDSSQLAVVCTAAQGKNMVVEGPPGTGKSQTITNMIAHFLATGKTVLFVAEKMAALEVVHERLSGLGLADFCLELHSSKAKKAEVAKDIIRTLSIANQDSTLNWEHEAEQLASARNGLTDLVTVLHQTRRNGLNVYEAMGGGIANKERAAAPFAWQDAEQHDAQELSQLKKMVGEMSALAGQLDRISEHPLALITQTRWSPSWQDDLLVRCKALNLTIEHLKTALIGFEKITPLTIETLSLNDLSALDKLANTLMRATDVPPQSVSNAHQVLARQQLQELIKQGEARNEAWDYFDAQYTAEVEQLNAQTLQTQWQAANSRFWLKKWLDKRRWMTQLKPYQRTKQTMDAHQVEGFLQTLAQLNAKDKYIQTHASRASEILGVAFQGHASNWDEAKRHLQWMTDYSQSLNDAYQSRIETLAETRTHLKTLLHEQSDMFTSGSVYFKLADDLRNVYRVFNAQWRELSALASPHTQTFSPLSSGALTYMQALFADWAQEKNQLQPWCVWQQKKSKAHEHGLEGLVASLESGEVQLSELQDFFDYSYKDWWVKKIFDKEPLLSEFSGATHQYKINEFKKLDEQFHLLTQRYIVAKLRGHMPDDVEQTSKLSTEIKFLRHQAQLKTRHKPIRTLMSETTGLLSRVKPCLLMSPLSVAQYLDAAHAQFDVVIFDEASQIPTWDAVGAIARGKQFICVGDPKQLPPTGFFSSGESDNASDNENLEEMESVLDECLSMGMSISTLDWHYRSKSEGLITF